MASPNSVVTPHYLIGGDSTDGTTIGINGGPVGFFGVTPSAQPTALGNTHTVSAGATTGVFTNTTFDGSIGTTAYTVGDLVAALKKLGIIKE